ncbi:MAG: hypothetical protein V1837_07280 [Candidatus Woesearchaeota archaeon]
MVSKSGDSHILLYGALVVVVGLIVIVGFRSIVQLNQSAQDAEVLQFITSLDQDAQTLSAKLGSLTQSTYSLPGAVKEVCFADLKASRESIGGVAIRNYPFIERSVDSGADKNVFLVGDNFFESYSVASLNLDDGVMFACINTEGKVLPLALKGSTKGTVLVKDWRVERVLASSATTDIVSADGSATLSVPAGASVSPTLSVEVISHPGYDFLSEAYKFGPSGTVFDPAATLSISFNPAEITVCPPDRAQFVFKLYDDNNQFIEDLHYDSVDCVNHVMAFRLDHFSWGGIAAVQPVQVVVAVENLPSGGSVTANGVACPATLSVQPNTVVYLVAAPATAFSGWSIGSSPVRATASYYYTATSTVMITARFAPRVVSGHGSGTFADPYKLDTLTSTGYSYYTSSPKAEFALPSGKIYYEVDPSAYSSNKNFQFVLKGYNNPFINGVTLTVRNKATGQDILTEQYVSSGWTAIYDRTDSSAFPFSTYKFIMGISNTGPSELAAVWWWAY